MSNASIFVPITKVDEEKRLVYGRIAHEVVDHADEVFDYDSSKSNFQRWSQTLFADSGGKSLGNVRGMHSNVAAGKLTSMNFQDAEKAIDVAAKVVDNNEWDKVLEGVYTGFSMGGSYQRKWPDVVNGKSVTRYTADPSEVSLVDRPCIPTAKFFDIQKKDGTVERKLFKSAEVAMLAGAVHEVVKEFLAPAGATSGINAYDLEGAKKPKKDAEKREFSAEERQHAAASGAAMPDGSFPIHNTTDLENAIRAHGRAKDPEKAKAHIISRAHALGASDKLPDDWKAKKMDEPTDEDVRKAVTTILEKRGARNSAADLKMLQSVHDTVCKLGAACSSMQKDGAGQASKTSEESNMAKDDDEVKKDAITAEGAKRGATVKDGTAGRGPESNNAAQKEPPTGGNGADRGFSSKRQKAEDEDESEMDDDDEDDVEDDVREKKARKMLKGMFKEFGENILKAVDSKLEKVLEKAAPKETGVTVSAEHKAAHPALFAVGKDGKAEKVETKEELLKNTKEVPTRALPGEKDNVATLIKAAYGRPMSHEQLYKR